MLNTVFQPKYCCQCSLTLLVKMLRYQICNFTKYSKEREREKNLVLCLRTTQIKLGSVFTSVRKESNQTCK